MRARNASHRGSEHTWATTRSISPKARSLPATPSPPSPILCGIGSHSFLSKPGAVGGSIISTTKKAAAALLGLVKNYNEYIELDLDLARSNLDRYCEHTGRTDDM